MLKKIAVEQLVLGMHLHKLEGAWLDHPFLRSRFVLTDADDLAQLRASKITHCWIDSAKGRDVEPAPAPASSAPPSSPPAAAAPPSPPAAAPPRAARAAPAGPTNCAIDDELQRAAVMRKRMRGPMRKLFDSARLGRAPDLLACEAMVEEISASVARNPGAFISLMRLKSRDDYTYMHSAAVCALMVGLGRAMGLSEDACREAGLAGMLHDVGKALMPLEVLNKPGKLSDEEFALIRTHCERGHELLLEGGGAGEAALDVCLHHHERVDGSGYPHRLAGEGISLLARMGAVCDVYDAVTSDRPYNRGWDPAEALARMASWRGHFDPPVLAQFVRLVGIFPVGAVVRLKSGKVAVVCDHRPGQPRSPVVKAFYSARSEMPIPVQRIDLAQPGCADAIVGHEPSGRWNNPQIEALWAGAAAA